RSLAALTPSSNWPTTRSRIGRVSMDIPNLRGVTVLVTGATGFIGSHLVDRLLSEGASVRCLLRPVSPRGGTARHLPPQGAKSILGDLITGAGLDTALDG